jgi:hypothetical protein
VTQLHVERYRTWRDRLWIFIAIALAAAYALTFTLGQFRSSSTHDTVQTETTYLADLATFANFIATDLNTVCHTLRIYLPATICAVAPSFPDPKGLPALGVHRP